MKNYYITNNENKFLLWKFNKHLHRRLLIFSLFSIISLTLILYNLKLIIILLLFILCLLSMQHMRYISWLGMFDLNTILTVYTTIHFGILAGFFVSNASVIGNLLLGEIDFLLFDVFMSFIIVIIASFFTISSMSIGIIICGVLYFIVGLVWFYNTNCLEFSNIMFLVTNLCWIWIFVTKILYLFI
jgi:hypothetical protein